MLLAYLVLRQIDFLDTTFAKGSANGFETLVCKRVAREVQGFGGVLLYGGAQRIRIEVGDVLTRQVYELVLTL